MVGLFKILLSSWGLSRRFSFAQSSTLGLFLTGGCWKDGFQWLGLEASRFFRCGGQLRSSSLGCLGRSHRCFIGWQITSLPQSLRRPWRWWILPHLKASENVSCPLYLSTLMPPHEGLFQQPICLASLSLTKVLSLCRLPWLTGIPLHFSLRNAESLRTFSSLACWWGEFSQ